MTKAALPLNFFGKYSVNNVGTVILFVSMFSCMHVHVYFQVQMNMYVYRKEDDLSVINSSDTAYLLFL